MSMLLGKSEQNKQRSTKSKEGVKSVVGLVLPINYWAISL